MLPIRVKFQENVLPVGRQDKICRTVLETKLTHQMEQFLRDILGKVVDSVGQVRVVPPPIHICSRASL